MHQNPEDTTIKPFFTPGPVRRGGEKQFDGGKQSEANLLSNEVKSPR